MNDLDDILKGARELGKKIAEHGRSKQFQAAAKAVEADKEAQSLMRSYREAVNKIATLEAQGKPIEPGDKRTAAEAQQKLAGNAPIKEMMKQQANYMEMMHSVMGAIEEAAAGEEKA